MDLRFVGKGEVRHEVNVFLHDAVRFCSLRGVAFLPRSLGFVTLKVVQNSISNSANLHVNIIQRKECLPLI